MSEPGNFRSTRPDWRDRLLLAWRRRGWRGFTRLYDLLLSPYGHRELVAPTRYGTIFGLNLFDSVDHHVINEGFYESEVLESVRPTLDRPGAVLWVIGANFGLHAVTAKALHSSCQVIAFEPFPRMAARLLANASRNHTEVHLHAYALSDRAGSATFHANDAGNPGESTLHPRPGAFYHHRFVVATHRADAVVAAGLAPAPTAVILDAEGAEAEVLDGFGSLLNAPTLQSIVFEAPNEFLSTHEPPTIWQPLIKHGFQIERLERREDTAHSLSNFLAKRSV